MKKVTFIALTFAAVAAVFTSCTKDKAAPTISFTVGSGLTINSSSDTITKTDEVTTDSASVTFNYTIDAEAEISELTAGVKGTTMKPITEAAGKTAYNKAVTIAVKAGSTVYVVNVKDKNDVSLSKEIVIVVKKKAVVIADLTAVSFTDEDGAAFIGAGGSAYGSYIDLDGGKIYHSKNVAANLSAIDAILNLTTLYDKGVGVTASTGVKFKKTTITATAFATAKEDALTGLIGTATATEIAIAEGDVLYFETKTNKGLLLIKTLTPETAASKNDAKMTIEVKLKK